MSARAAVFRWSVLSVLAGLAGLLAAGRAHAAPTPCKVDLDCPNAACGGEVCVHSSGLSMCVPAHTSGASGINDGWCASPDGGAEVDSNCKCASMGATCEGFFCSFTIPPGGGTGGSTGTGGSGTGTGGSGTGSGGTGTGGGGGGDGCSIAAAPAFGGAGAGAGLALLAAVLRRRRRARHRG